MKETISIKWYQVINWFKRLFSWHNPKDKSGQTNNEIRKLVINEIKVGLMKVHLVYNKYDCRGTQGYNYKEVHKLLKKVLKRK